MKELKRIMLDETPATPTGRPREEIEAEISEITKLLAGPLSNFERLDLVEARRALRKQL